MPLSYSAWATFIERRHRAILVGSLLVCILSGLSLLRLRLDFDVLEMLPRGRPAFDDFKSFIADFGQLDELLVLVSATQGKNVPLSKMQAFADAFGGRLVGLDTVASVQVRLDLERLLAGILGRYLPNYLPEAAYDELERRLTPDGIEAQLAINRAVLSAPFDLSSARAVREDPFGLRRMVAEDLARSAGAGRPSLSDGYFTAPGGDALLIFARPKSAAFDTVFSNRLLAQVRAAEADARREVPSDGIVVEYTGSYVYAVEDATAIRWDVQRYTLLALVGVLSVFYAGYRNLRILPFVTYPLVVSTLVTFPADLLVYGKINAVSTSFAAILYGLSIDTGIHFYNRLLEERRQSDLRAAVAATVAGLFRPVLAASATSAIVFVVVGFSCIAGVSQLGFLTAFGVLLNPLQLFLLYPALAFLLPRSVEVAGTVEETPRLARLAEIVSRRARLVCLIAAAVGIVLLIAATRVKLDVSLTSLRPHVSEAVRVQEEIERRFSQLSLAGSVLVRRADREMALADSETVASQLQAYEKEELIRSVSSVGALLPSERTQRRRLERYNRLPRRAAMQAFRAALARHGFATGPFEPFIAWFEREHHEIVRAGDPALAPLSFLIDRYVRGRDGTHAVATYIEPAPAVSLESVGERLRRELPTVEMTVTGRPVLEAELYRVVRRELIAFLVWSLFGNLLLLRITFGRLRDALIILVPVVWASAALLALMSLTGMPLNPVNLIAPTLILGLGVDYGAFLVARAREQGGMSAAIRSNGKALVVTGLTTVVGFGCLSLSTYPALSSMGLLAAIGLLLSLISSIFLVPALWVVVSVSRPTRSDPI